MMIINKLLSTILPSSVQSQLKSYYRNIRASKDRIYRFFNRPVFKEDDGKIFVNLGCGTTNHPEFINIDSYPHRHVHYVSNIGRLDMFIDDSVDLIYASHCLEHFKYSEIDRVLSEWNRVLKPGGVLRLSVPDFDKLLDIYSDTGDPDDIVEQIMGGQNNKYNYHYIIFNKNNLIKHLVCTGFTDAREWVPGSCSLTTFDDFSVYHKTVEGKVYPISLNLEANKAKSK